MTEIDQLRRMKKWLRQENARFSVSFVPVPESEWPSQETTQHKAPRIACWRSCNFLVQQFQRSDGWSILTINRCVLRDDGQFDDRITWDELQEIKSDLGFASRLAIEIYPPAEHVVNVANMRHLWLVPANVPIPFWTHREQRPHSGLLAESILNAK